MVTSERIKTAGAIAAAIIAAPFVLILLLSVMIYFVVIEWQVFWLVAPKVVLFCIPVLLAAIAIDYRIHNRSNKKARNVGIFRDDRRENDQR